MLTAIARKNITLSTDKGDYKVTNRQRLYILSTRLISMFDKNYIELTFKSGSKTRKANVLASEFTTLFA